MLNVLLNDVKQDKLGSSHPLNFVSLKFFRTRVVYSSFYQQYKIWYSQTTEKCFTHLSGMHDVVASYSEENCIDYVYYQSILMEL